MAKLPVIGIAAIALSCAATSALADRGGVRETYYTVYGSTVEEMNKVIRANAPRGGRARGLGIIDFHRSFQTVVKDGVCHVRDAKVETEIKLILPKWQAGSKPKGRVARKWRALNNLIRDHEYKHVRIAQRYGRIMKKRLSRLKSSKGCWSLRADAQKVIQATIKEHIVVQRAFDRRELRRFKRLR